MAGYDPKRSRPPTAPAEQTPAPVDALLDPVIATDVAEDVATAPEPAEVDLRQIDPDVPAARSVASAPSVTPSPVELAPAPDPITGRVAVIAGVAAAAAIAVVLFRRRRR